MIARGKLNAVLVVSGLAGVLIGGLALAGDTYNRFHGHDAKGDAVPICSSASAASGPTFYSEMAQVNARMHAGMDVKPSGNPDRDFARMMIPHHQGAIDMALVELKYGQDGKLRRLAQSIIVEQGQEIAYMRTLLASPQDPSTTGPAAEK